MKRSASRHIVLATTLATIAWWCTAPCAMGLGVTYDGIYFPQGDASFADEFVSYQRGPGAVNDDPKGDFADPLDALGPPDWVPPPADTGTVSLGTSADPGSGLDAFLVLRFVDNALTASGDNRADLHIFEVGGSVESFHVWIAESLDSNWVYLGRVAGQPTSIDIDAIPQVVPGRLYRYVKLQDGGDELSGAPYAGADIDAVGAISTTLTPVPEPHEATWMLLGLAALWCAGSRRPS